MTDGPMYYTIDSLLLDNGKSLTLSDYDKNKPIGDELVAFMTGHLNGVEWKVGTTTQFGHHSFLLEMQPGVESLRFWKNAKKNQWKVRANCNGQLEVRDSEGMLRASPKSTFKDKKMPVDQVNQFDSLEDFLRAKLRRFNS